MNFKVICYTLFDITQTGITSRNKPPADVDPVVWTYKRNTQCNLDTILQVINLRSQPEIINTPEKIQINLEEFQNFGFLFKQDEEEIINCWKFIFEIQHSSVFYDGINELGSLYRDCDKVPMIKCGTEWNKLPAFLDTSDELKNIYFQVIKDA